MYRAGKYQSFKIYLRDHMKKLPVSFSFERWSHLSLLVQTSLFLWPPLYKVLQCM